VKTSDRILNVVVAQFLLAEVALCEITYVAIWYKLITGRLSAYNQ